MENLSPGGFRDIAQRSIINFVFTPGARIPQAHNVDGDAVLTGDLSRLARRHAAARVIAIGQQNQIWTGPSEPEASGSTPTSSTSSPSMSVTNSSLESSYAPRARFSSSALRISSSSRRQQRRKSKGQDETALLRIGCFSSDVHLPKSGAVCG